MKNCTGSILLMVGLLIGCAQEHREVSQEVNSGSSTSPTAVADTTSDASDESATAGPSDPAERSRIRFERMLRKIEPTLRGDPKRLPQYIQFLAREFVTDQRLFAFAVQA